MWKNLMIFVIVTFTNVCGLLLGGGDFASLNPFERMMFEGVQGIPAPVLYKMADGSVADAMKIKTRLSLLNGSRGNLIRAPFPQQTEFQNPLSRFIQGIQNGLSPSGQQGQTPSNNHNVMSRPSNPSSTNNKNTQSAPSPNKNPEIQRGPFSTKSPDVSSSLLSTMSGIVNGGSNSSSSQTISSLVSLLKQALGIDSNTRNQAPTGNSAGGLKPMSQRPSLGRSPYHRMRLLSKMRLCNAPPMSYRYPNFQKCSSTNPCIHPLTECVREYWGGCCVINRMALSYLDWGT